MRTETLQEFHLNIILLFKLNMDSSKPNPLLLPNIVSNVLHHIPNLVNLEKLRLVCQCWNQEACYILRKNKIIEFTNVTSMQSYNTIFQHTYQFFEMFPHSKYKLSAFPNEQLVKSTKTAAPQLVLDMIIDEFLDNFGNFIVYFYLPVRTGFFNALFLDRVLNKLPNISTLGLHIQYYNFNQQSLQSFSQSTIKNLNHVKSLIISIDGLETSEDMTIMLLSSMFMYLPNLKRISYPGDIRRISKTGLLLRDIILESESSTLTKLCELNFKMRLLEEHCLELLCKDFPIKSLYIDLYNPEDDEQCVSSEIMAGLFRKWSATLDHLEVEFPFRKEISYHFHFPVVMENLSTLYLGGLECSVLELLQKLPKLRKLDLSQLDLGSVLPKPSESDVYSNVVQLRLDFCTGQTAGILSRFSRIFPYLCNLNINHATNEVARMIFQKMNHLTTLTIQGSDLSDAGMCGFSEYSVKENDFMRLSSVQGKKFRKYAYIADLKELQYLILDAYALTEVTVRHGLVHCLSLRLVKMDCTAGESSSTTLSRKFKLSEYENFLVEDRQGIVEMKEDPPMDDDMIAFFSVKRHI